MKRTHDTSCVVLAATLLAASGAWARYKPANFDALPELPVTGGSVHYVVLTNSDYKVTGTGMHVLSESGTGTPIGALRFASDLKKVTLWMEAGSSISAEGRSPGENEYVGGGAGIHLPNDKTLVLRCVDANGTARVYAIGGNGLKSLAGEAGARGYSSSYGSGGYGGAGASAGGAGIGGYGGARGGGGDFGVGGDSPSAGKDGGKGGKGGDGSGTIWCYDGVELHATPGVNGVVGYGTAAAGGANTSGQWGGGGGGAGGGGASGLTPSIGGGASGGGGGGGGGGAWGHGGSGGGGGAEGGLGGMGGTGGSIGGYSNGKNGKNASGKSGGAGGEEEGSTVPGAAGGRGGDMSDGGEGGVVWCADFASVTNGIGNATPTGYGAGESSSVANARIDLDLCGKTADNAPDACALAATNAVRTLFDSPVGVPSAEGWEFMGYYTLDTGGEKVIDTNGTVNTKIDIAGATKLYAQWKLIAAVPAGAELTANGATLTLAVTNTPARQDTYGFWYYSHDNVNWTAFTPEGYSQQNFQSCTTQIVSVATLADGSQSGEYYFRCDLVTTRWGNGTTLTNASNIASSIYVRRDTPVYDADTKTLWANGSALKIMRDSRDASRVVVYWDRAWDGKYEGAFSRGLTLSAVDTWVNGGFKDGSQVGGGVKIDFVSGEVYGLDAGDNIAPAIRDREHVMCITHEPDSVVGKGGMKNWP